MYTIQFKSPFYTIETANKPLLSIHQSVFGPLTCPTSFTNPLELNGIKISVNQGRVVFNNQKFKRGAKVLKFDKEKMIVSHNVDMISTFKDLVFKVTNPKIFSILESGSFDEVFALDSTSLIFRQSGRIKKLNENGTEVLDLDASQYDYLGQGTNNCVFAWVQGDQHVIRIPKALSKDKISSGLERSARLWNSINGALGKAEVQGGCQYLKLPFVQCQEVSDLIGVREENEIINMMVSACFKLYAKTGRVLMDANMSNVMVDKNGETYILDLEETFERSSISRGGGSLLRKDYNTNEDYINLFNRTDAYKIARVLVEIDNLVANKQLLQSDFENPTWISAFQKWLFTYAHESDMSSEALAKSINDAIDIASMSPQGRQKEILSLYVSSRLRKDNPQEPWREKITNLIKDNWKGWRNFELKQDKINELIKIIDSHDDNKVEKLTELNKTSSGGFFSNRLDQIVQECIEIESQKDRPVIKKS
tara:strand:- start:10603 stop:12042 length:1440 start_codon:yes stop_codon:yes gene_type:complete